MKPPRSSVRAERALLAAIHCWAVYGVTRLPSDGNRAEPERGTDSAGKTRPDSSTLSTPEKP